MKNDPLDEPHVIRVFVDAKILGRDDPTKPKRTFVAYVVENRPASQGFTEIKEEGADETDQAELHAIAFAIRELRQDFSEFTVMSDNQSVVDVIHRSSEGLPKPKGILAEIREQRSRNLSIQVQWYEKNPAHRVLNAHVLKYLEGEHNSSNP